MVVKGILNRESQALEEESMTIRDDLNGARFHDDARMCD